MVQKTSSGRGLGRLSSVFQFRAGRVSVAAVSFFSLLDLLAVAAVSFVRCLGSRLVLVLLARARRFRVLFSSIVSYSESREMRVAYQPRLESVQSSRLRGGEGGRAGAHVYPDLGADTAPPMSPRHLKGDSLERRPGPDGRSRRHVNAGLSLRAVRMRIRFRAFRYFSAHL